MGFAAAVFASAANAANDKTVTSKTYVDTKYVAGTGITVTPNADTGKNVIALDSTLDTTEYTAGDNISIANHEISANVGVKGIKAHGASGTLGMDSNGVVELPAEQTVNDGTLTIQVGTNTAQTFTANTAGDTTVNLGAAAGAGLAAGITDGEQGLTSGDQVYDFVIDQVADGYVAGTNVQITDGTGANAGKKVVSATDTTYTADGTTVQLSNGQFSANTTGGVADGGTNLTTGDQVYDFVIDQVADGYVAGTNVQITDGTGANAGKKVVSATDTTYTADGTTVQLSNGQFSANTTGGVADGGSNLTTGDQVYDFVTGLIPGTIPSTCTAAAPCALVFAGGTTPTWEPIQQ